MDNLVLLVFRKLIQWTTKDACRYAREPMSTQREKEVSDECYDPFSTSFSLYPKFLPMPYSYLYIGGGNTRKLSFGELLQGLAAEPYLFMRGIFF